MVRRFLLVCLTCNCRTADQTAIQDKEYLKSCEHWEADTRILLHVVHCAKQGYKHFAIKILDTDVAVLAVGHLQSLDIEQI